MSTKISGSKYAAMYGPTTGDKVRLADTSLVIEVEKDYTTYGDEVKFGGGKTIRDGMGQSVKTCSKDGDLDLVITNALIVDSTGIVKADIGIKDGKIAGIGKAGNPDIMDGVTPGMTVGASTEALAGEGMIVTAGGIDTHIHFISPQQIDCALYSGVTTMIGGGTGPADGTNATTCTPGPWNLKMMLKAAEEYPMNLGFLGKGNCSDEVPLIEQVKAGAMGLKIHEDWGATPAVINHCLNVADEYDVQVAIHTDTLNEGGCVEDTINAIGGRTIHTYHTEGAGGGHAPDIIKAAATPNILPSSTNPTMPYTVNTLDEHLDMLMVCHHLDKKIPEDVAVTGYDNSLYARQGQGITTITYPQENWEINAYPVNEIAEYVQDVSQGDIDVLVEEYYNKYDMILDGRDPEEFKEHVAVQAGIEIGFERFLEEKNYQAIVTHFGDLGALKQLPGLAIQRLMEKGYGFGGEGDWKTAAMGIEAVYIDGDTTIQNLQNELRWNSMYFSK